MKKKLFTIALALCMVFTMMPAGVFQVETAWASSTDKPTHVEVAGVEMVDDTANQTFYQNDAQAASTVETTDYNAMYDKKSNTLTLKGFTYNGPEMGVYANGDLKIAVVGENTITSTKYGIWTKGDLTISGTNSTTDKLNVTSSGRNAIFAFEDDTDKFFNYAESINISHVSINALADGGDVGIGAPNTVTIKNSYVVSTGKEHGIQGGYFDPADVEGTGNRGNIIITNSVIKAEATSEGANALEKTVTVDGKTYNHKNAQIVNIPDVHEHCICGGSVSSGGHVHDSNVTWTKWTETTSLPDKAGNYYLTEDVALSNTWYPKDGTVLCLSGHTITANGDFKAIRVEAGRSFTLTDCELGGKKGSVTHASGEKGSGVYTLGDFIMYGGTISGNDSNTSATGGGVDVNGSSQGASSFTMYGGTISGNTAISGGGLYVNTGNSFTMYGGRIRGNNVTGNGGGVYMKGTITISGDSRITDNTHSYGNGGKDNVCLAKEDVSITITGTLSGKIGVNEYYLPQAGNVIATGVDANTDYTNIIISDLDGFEIAHDSTDGTSLVWKTKDTPTPTEHKHYICGTECKAIGDHQKEESKITFDKKIWMDGEKLKIGDTEWTYSAYGGDGYVYELPAGNYYLDSNITIDGCIRIESKAVNLCLNGHTITGAGLNGSNAIRVGEDETSSAEFTLTDCETGNAQGKITRQSEKLGRGVFVLKNSKFNMYGGSIVGHKYSADNNGGAGVSAMGTFNMYGGNISNNSAIGGNTYGGGVFAGGTFNMYGGSITGNTASDGGSGVIVNISAKTGNVGTFTVSGNVNITDNKTTKGQPDNVYLEKSEDGTRLASITIGSTLNVSEKIGVRTANKPTEENPIVIATGVSSGVEDNFVSDDSNYVVAYENGNLVLKTNPNPPAPEPEHKHYICGETHQSIGDHTSDTQTEFQAWTSTTTLPTEAGNYYLTDNVTLAATWVVPENVNINLCMNGFDIYVDDTTRKTAPYKTAIYINSNRQLTLTDCESKSKIEYRGDSFCNGIWLEPNAKANIYNITITKFDSISQISMGIVNYGTVNMYNGNICDNKKISTEQGYGVNGVRNYDTFNMYGGTITGNDTGVYNAGAMKLGGDVNIKGNNVNMLYAKDLRGVGTMTLENLGENADIGITPYSNPTKGNPVVIVSSGAKAADAAKFSLDNDENNEYEIYLSNASKGELSIGVKGDKKPSTGGSGSSIQRPTIIADEGANASLNYNGSRLTIAAKNGYEITDVLLNGVSKGAVTELMGLRTGDKVEVKTAKKAEQTDPATDNNAKLIKGVENTTIVLKSKLTKNKNVLLTWTKSKGYKVDKFEFYRSVKKSSGYGKAAFFITKDGSWSKYLNNKELKEGKTYYYKVRGVRVIDGQKYYTQWSNKAWRTIK